jgi:S1-C subfamily serine protease
MNAIKMIERASALFNQMRKAKRQRTYPIVLAFAASAACPTAARPDPPRGPDVIRPTVQIRNGNGRGSGTVIASSPDRTLVLTAAHVIKDGKDLKVELHRHNLGLAATGLTEGGGWPRLVPATVAAVDPAADVAVLEVRGMVALRYVARFDPNAAEPARGETLTSVGIDRTLFLTRWTTKVEGSAQVDFNKGGGPRRFTVTARFPEHGRSGGGLFRADGSVVGVCTGQLSIRPGQPKVGLFASVTSVRRLLEESHLDVALGPPSPSRSSPAGPRPGPRNSGLPAVEVSGKEGSDRNH